MLTTRDRGTPIEPVPRSSLQVRCGGPRQFSLKLRAVYPRRQGIEWKDNLWRMTTYADTERGREPVARPNSGVVW